MAWGTFRNLFTKPSEQVAAPPGTSFCGRANSCPKRETSNFFAFLVNSFFSVFQSVCEVGALCLDVAVLLEQLEALLDGLLVLGHRLLVARRLRVVLQSVQQHVGPVVSLQVEQERRKDEDNQ